jgi:hypothetical protein
VAGFVGEVQAVMDGRVDRFKPLQKGFHYSLIFALPFDPTCRTFGAPEESEVLS